MRQNGNACDCSTTNISHESALSVRIYNRMLMRRAPGGVTVNSLMFVRDLFGDFHDHLSVAKINPRKHNSCA